MKVVIRAAVLAAATFVAAAGRADTTWIYAVQLTAAVRADPARIELSWPTDFLGATGYSVARKGPRDATWGDSVDLPGDATTFDDDNVSIGNTYEYRVIKRSTMPSGPFIGTGYIAVGLNAALIDQRGKVILVVDSSIAGPADDALKTLQRDLAGDGWTVVRKDVGRDDSPSSVRDQIKAEYDADRDHVKAVLLFGHVPVVRAGNLNVDGHRARPMPADVYYGEMDGPWTDANGDGVLDQSLLPSDVDLEVGRVDFADLPGTYAAAPYPSEIDLLRNYVAKEHAFRTAAVRPAARALVGNAVGDGGGQAYAAAAYRNFAPFVGVDKIVNAGTDSNVPDDQRWFTQLRKDDYLWAFGCGAGSDLTIGSLGTHGQYHDLWASDFLDQKPKATFYLLFGSWFVDWAQRDNVMRSALASSDYGLAAAWSGRPHLFLHHMAAGETVGYGMRVSQNNDGKVYQNQLQRQVRGIHVALMGDPTLRLNYLAPATALSARASGGDVALAWQGSADTTIGYHVYRGSDLNGPFTRLTDAPVTDTRFTDPGHAGESAIYMVRAVSLQVGPSGSYYNASEGTFVTYGPGVAEAAAGPEAAPSPRDDSGPALPFPAPPASADRAFAYTLRGSIAAGQSTLDVPGRAAMKTGSGNDTGEAPKLRLMGPPPSLGRWSRAPAPSALAATETSHADSAVPIFSAAVSDRTAKTSAQ